MTKIEMALVMIVMIAIGEAGLCWHFYKAGEHKIDKQDLVLEQAHTKQVAAQAAKDKQDASATIADLRSQLHDALLPVPTSAVRVCVASGGGEGRAPSGPSAGAQPGEPARPADDQRVLAGDRQGPDVSADVRALAEAGVILATYRQSLVDWSERQSQPLKGAASP